MIHLYRAALPHNAEDHFVSLLRPRDKYAACFYSPVAMDHFYHKAVEEDRGAEWDGEGADIRKSKGEDGTEVGMGFRKQWVDTLELEHTVLLSRNLSFRHVVACCG